MILADCHNPDEFEECLSEAATGAKFSALKKSTFHARSRLAQLDNCAMFSVQAENMRCVIRKPFDFIGITVPLASSFEVKDGRNLISFDPGVAHILTPSEDFDFRTLHSSSVLCTNIFRPLLEELVAKLNAEQSPATLHLNNHLSLRTENGQSFWRHLNFIWGELNYAGGSKKSSLATTELEKALITSLVFAINEQTDNLLYPEEDYCSPLYLRRAVEFIESNLEVATGLADIALAAGVSARTLNRVFRKHHGIGPIAFLRQLRLSAVNPELLGANPACETVTIIASRYGFHELGRFANAYRASFGELPSQTLRR